MPIPPKPDNAVRCTKCSIGKDPQGMNVGGAIFEVSPGVGQCCNCNTRYVVKKKEKAIDYNPDKYIESEDIPF